MDIFGDGANSDRADVSGKNPTQLAASTHTWKFLHYPHFLPRGKLPHFSHTRFIKKKYFFGASFSNAASLSSFSISPPNLHPDREREIGTAAESAELICRILHNKPDRKRERGVGFAGGELEDGLFGSDFDRFLPCKAVVWIQSSQFSSLQQQIFLSESQTELQMAIHGIRSWIFFLRAFCWLWFSHWQKRCWVIFLTKFLIGLWIEWIWL